MYVDTKVVLNYSDSNHSYNERLGKEFSVFQEIYKILFLLDDTDFGLIDVTILLLQILFSL